jgi:hypothetical protein
MKKEPTQDVQHDDDESKVMGLPPTQLARKIIGAAVIVIVLLIVISVVVHA